MPQQPARGSKRKEPLEEIPSSQTFGSISYIRRGDKVIKKRTVEKTNSDPASSSTVFPDDRLLPALGSQAGPSEPAANTFEGPSSGAANRSVSVNPVSPCHVVSRSYPFQTKVQEHPPSKENYGLMEQARSRPASGQSAVCGNRTASNLVLTSCSRYHKNHQQLIN